MKGNRILVTGAASGLGRYLHEALGGEVWLRESKIYDLRGMEWDLIVHCAFNSARDIDLASLHPYYVDNVALTEELVSLPHRLFVFISTLDVYRGSASSPSTETDPIHLDTVQGIYPVTKLLSESCVIASSPDCLILRPSALLGPFSRRNSLIRIIEDERPELTLSPLSSFNYILYETVLGCLNVARESNLRGIYNIASTDNVTLGELSRLINPGVRFGDFVYDVGHINNEKAAREIPELKQTSKDVALAFARTRGWRPENPAGAT